jgi:hypothetical protein
MTEHGLRTDKMDTKIFKNSGRDLRPKCRECPKLSVRTSLANLDHPTQRVPHGSLSRVSPLLGFQLRFLIKTIGTQAIRCHIACPVVESPVCHVPAPRTVPGKIQKQGRLSSFTESFFWRSISDATPNWLNHAGLPPLVTPTPLYLKNTRTAYFVPNFFQ